MNPVFVAIDMADLDAAELMASKLVGRVYGFKLGLEFFLTHGILGYHRIAKFGPIFLDLKLHDIQNTVTGALVSMLKLKPEFMTLHISGGPEMLRTAIKYVADSKTRLLGVTVLTSLNSDDLKLVGQHSDVEEQVLRLAHLAKSCGIHGVVCSPKEVKLITSEYGNSLIRMVPGIRPNWASTNDQKRVMTPKEAMQAGADYLVIGRPITHASNPIVAANRIMEELK